MALLSVASAMAVTVASPVADAPPLPIFAAASTVAASAPDRRIVPDIVPYRDPLIARARLRQPTIAFQAPARFVAIDNVPIHTTGTTIRKSEVRTAGRRVSTYAPRQLLIGADYMGSRPRERGISPLGSRIVLRMTSEATSLAVNGGVAGALLRLAALTD